MPSLFFDFFDSPLGQLQIISTNENLQEIRFDMETDSLKSTNPNSLTRECKNQLEAYFEKKLTVFDLPLGYGGTDFQQKVWQALVDIPYGTTKTYLWLAEIIGNKKAVRAVGGANGKNPIPIVVPCHRVIGQNGKLVGYAGGIWRKKWLLEHEGLLQQGELPFFE